MVGQRLTLSNARRDAPAGPAGTRTVDFSRNLVAALSRSGITLAVGGTLRALAMGVGTEAEIEPTTHFLVSLQFSQHALRSSGTCHATGTGHAEDQRARLR